jgi:tetratricopeptide (TPR) repeat protein
LARARAAGDTGRPTVAARLCRRALALIDPDRPEDRELRLRILVTLSFSLVESGDTDGALAVLDSAADDVARAPMVAAAKGTVMLRAGRSAEAMGFFDAAIEGFGPENREDHSTVLLNRGFQHMQFGDLVAAQRDTAAAERLAVEVGSDVLIFMAGYNLGYIRFLAGDLPGALDAMSAAERLAPESALGVPALDRARVLLAAGLIGEAKEYDDSAIVTFTANRALTDLEDALMVGSDIAVMAGDPARARSMARTAARISGRRGNVPAKLLAQLAEQRALAAMRSSPAAPRMESGRARNDRQRRARADAKAATDLSGRLDAVGLRQDATAASLLAAEALLDAGDPAAAAAQHRARDTGGSALATRLQSRLVAARIELAQDRRRDGLALLRRGLDELAGFQALFGSQDLQAAGAVWGRQLSRLGLRAAVATGSPAEILQWLERARATTTRLPHVRPPADPELAADLGALRVAQDALRVAVLSGRADPAQQREVDELRRRVRARSWTLGGTGSAIRPQSLASVRRTLARHGGVVLAYFHGAGGVHLLRITATTAEYRSLFDLSELEQLTRRAGADLELLSSDRIPDAIRTVANRSLGDALEQMSARLVDAALVGTSGPVLVSGVGPLGLVPWTMLPGLTGRPVSVTHSVTMSLAGLRDRRPPAPKRVLAVAGPHLDRAEEEVEAVVARHPDAVALTGPAATGATVLDEIPRGGVLHIAAHGHHEADNPLFSSVLLADGPLFAYDIAPVPALPEQIVLSSCDVGRTAVRADAEPLGLAVALLRSGVRTVIASVAPVSDRVAAAVMADYHSGLAGGAGPAEALAVALGQERDGSAPFTCYGAGE